MSLEKKYTIKQLADSNYIGYGERKIRIFIKSGELDAHEIKTGKNTKYLIPESSINAFLEKRIVSRGSKTQENATSSEDEVESVL